MKRFTAALLTVIMVMTMSFSAVVPAMACETGVSYGETGCSPLSLTQYVRRLQAQAIVAAANLTIESMVRIAQCSPRPNIDALVNATNQISKKTQAACAAINVEVTCEAEWYWIAGQWIEIDPLRVVG